MQNLSEQQHDMEPEEERPKDVDFVMPMEFDDNEPLGNLYKEILANPVTRTMDYGKDCILPRTKITREECQRGKLLTFLYEKHKRENPDQWERGIPGNDLKAFMKFPVECRTCLLYRYAPGSPENVKDGCRTPHEIKERRIWGGMGGLIAMLFTTGLGQDLAGLSFLTSAILGTFLGASVFYIAQGRAPKALADHAHGPREANSSPRGVLRPRGTAVPTDHEGIRYREVDGLPMLQTPPPAGAIIEGKAEPTPHIQAAAPPTIAGGNTAQTPEPARATPAPVMKGPGQIETEIVVPAQWAEPKAPAKEVLPVKPEAAPVKESAPAVPPTPPAPKNPTPAKTPKQPSKKAKGKAPVKKAEAKVEEKKQEPKKEPAPVKEPPAPAVTGFPCDHPGCGKVCQTKAALTSHKITHKKAGASPQASKN